MAFNGNMDQNDGDSSADQVVLDAAEVYMLMKEEYRISRNIRASWFLRNINKCISVKDEQELLSSQEELEILSVIPKTKPSSPELAAGQKYRLLPTCHVTFLARRYRLVIVLDLSPSMTAVDIQSGNVHMAETHTALKNFLKGATKPFCVPGSSILLAPSLYVTVIAYTPLAQLTTQQVLVQGCLLTPDNVDVFLQSIHVQLEEFENKIFNSMMRYYNPTTEEVGVDSWLNDRADFVVGDDQPDFPPRPPDRSQHNSQNVPKFEMASPEAAFVNMLWCGVLALQLLPENTSSGIVVISDGVAAVPDALTLNTLLGTLRNGTTAVSFIQLGKGYYPHAGFGYVPHTEIMQFIATATFGAFLSRCPSTETLPDLEMNMYHRAFLSWNFQKGLEGIKIDVIKGRQHQVISSESGWPESIQPSFAVNKQGLCTIPLQRKKHASETLSTGLANVLSVRLREGYTIKDACLIKNGSHIQVRLALPWKYNARIEYIASAPWPLQANRHLTHIEIYMEGSYEFLHDITCPQKGPQNSYRKKVIKNFWQMLRSLKETDNLLVHLQSFAANPIYYTIPEGTKGGMPLFYMPPNSTIPVLAQQLHIPKDTRLDQFAAFWKRIALMDPKRWQRWFHMHRIGMLLLPDLPLPKHLHLPNTSGRYPSIQYRMALKEVNSLLKKRCTFIMLDNHSYIKLNFTESGGPPTSFYIIRISAKTPLVLRLAFLGGTPGHERNKVVMDLKQDLLALRMPKKKHTQYVYDKDHGGKLAMAQRDSDSDCTPGMGSDSCVVLLARPIEMILMRYDKMPSDFTDLKTSIEDTVTSIPVYMSSKAPSSNLNRLACYLHHRRWIWEAQSDSGIQISTKAVANILDVLTKLRLQQGFHVAYSTSGILSFVMELKMKNPLDTFVDPSSLTEAADGESENTEQTSSSDKQDVYPCSLQYIIFPPHSATFKRDRASSDVEDDDGDDQDTSEADGRLQLVTECWVEPQSGTIIDSPKQCQIFDGLTYHAIPNSIFPIDQRIVSILLNFEHLRVMCSSDIDRDMGATSSHEGADAGVEISETIQRMPYTLDVLKLLPMCQQAHILCSTFIPVTDETENSRNGQRFRHPKPNDTLFSLLVDSIRSIVNFQLDLSDMDSLLFAQSVLHRKPAGEGAPSRPFNLTLDDIAALIESLNGQQPGDGGVKSPRGGQRGGGMSALTAEDEERKIPRWTMFVNDVGKDHLILVFMPASYHDLQILNAPTKADKKDDGEGEDTQKEDVAQKEESNSQEDEERKEKDRRDRPKMSLPNRGLGKEATNASLPLPMFVYDCSLAALTNYLLGRLDEGQVKSIFKDVTFATLEKGHQVPTTPRNVTRHRSRGYSEQNENFVPPQMDSKGGKALEWFCGSLANKVHKAFVIGIFRSLQFGQRVDSRDVQCAIDWVCDESLYEIDITKFVRYVCGHIFRVQAKVDAEQQVADRLQKRIKFADEDDGDDETVEKTSAEKTQRPEVKSSLTDRKPSSVVIPLDVLTSAGHRSCEISRNLHSVVQERFTQVMGHHFKPVPSNRDIWYYHLQREGEEDEEDEEDEDGDGEKVEEDEERPDHGAEYDDDQVFMEGGANTGSFEDDGEGVKQSPRFSGSRTPEVFSENPSAQQVAKPAKPNAENAPSARLKVNSVAEGYEGDRLNEFDIDEDIDRGYEKEYDSKINSIVDAYQKSARQSFDLMSEPSRRGSSEESVMGSEEEEMSPLFVTLVCSVKLKKNVGHMVVRTIPTCLGDLISCLESAPSEEVDLRDLSVTLDIMCLTLPPDLDFMQEVGDLDDEDTYRGPSFTEHSPPTSPCPGNHHRANTLSTSDAGELNEMMDSLGSLPDAQKDAIHATEEEVNWLLEDEIVSAMVHVKRITVATLDIVARHVERSRAKPNCKAEELALQFVFGPEQSMSKFTNEFERLSIPKYQFTKNQDYWYLSLDQLHAETLRKGRELKNALETYNNQLKQQDQVQATGQRQDQVMAAIQGQDQVQAASQEQNQVQAAIEGQDQVQAAIQVQDMIQVAIQGQDQVRAAVQGQDQTATQVQDQVQATFKGPEVVQEHNQDQVQEGTKDQPLELAIQVHDQGSVIPTTTIICTPPSPEKQVGIWDSREGHEEDSQLPGDAVQGTAHNKEENQTQAKEVKDCDAGTPEDRTPGRASPEDEWTVIEDKTDIEVGVDVSMEIDDLEDDEMTPEGATATDEKERDVQERRSGQEDKEKKSVETDNRDDDDEMMGKGRMESEEDSKVEGQGSKVAEEGEDGEVRPRHAEDNVSRSSGSSIQVLSEEHTPDEPGVSMLSEALALPRSDYPDSSTTPTPSQSGREEGGEETFSGEGSEGGSTLRRSSVSFEVLTRVGQDDDDDDDNAAMGETHREPDVSALPASPDPPLPLPPSHRPDGTSSPTSHLTSPSPPFSSSTSGSPPRGRVGSIGAKRHTHSRQGSGVGVSSEPSSLFQSYVSHNGSSGDNDEGGYEASSSDVEPEECLLSVDVFSHTMPEFWLILKLCRDRVNLFFHTRERNESSKLVHQREIYQQVSEAIRNTCRLVNQRLLLQELDNRKMCSKLLVAESDEDIWRQEDSAQPTTRRMLDDEDLDDHEHGGEDYLAATLDFNPGHFACGIVLTTELPVHTRLKPSHRPGVASRGLQALKTALAAFAVHDRKNLFVYRESSGEVFYLRLNETTVVSHQVPSRLCSIAESSSQPNSQPTSQSVSRATSIQSLNTITGSLNVEDDAISTTASLESRRDSGVDLQSIASTVTKASALQGAHHIIELKVYGVTKAGPEIQSDLVDLLNKKLESATLDVIADMLARNPLCKLTPDDVQFIQPRGKPPTQTFQFTVPHWAIKYLYSVRFYLRQNLLQNQFLHPPKYIDGKPDNHFQDCVSWKGRGLMMGAGPDPCEADVFLYNRPHKAEGGTGIACVATSLVDGCGNPVVLVDCPTPSPASQIDPFTEVDFKTLITTHLYQPAEAQGKRPGPTALIEFFIWRRGSVDLATPLHQAVEHALCDTLTEYCLLTAPMAHVSGDRHPLPRPRKEQAPSPLASPTLVRAETGRPDIWKKTVSSPVSMKRSMSVGESPQFFAADIKLLLKRIQKRSQSVTPGLLASGGSASSSESTLGRARRLIEGASPLQSPVSSRPHTPTKSKTMREFSPKDPALDSHLSWREQEINRRMEEETRERRREAEEGKGGLLHPMYSGLALRWFAFMDELDAPSVNVLRASLSCQFSVQVFLQEFLEKLAKICTDCTQKLYKADGKEMRPFTPPPSKKPEPDPLKPNQPLPGSEQTFILIGRNVHQWRYSLDCSSLDEPLQPPNLTNPKSQKSFQQFDPLDLSGVVSDRCLHPSGLPGLRQAPHSTRLVVPRQRLLLLRATNKQILVYIYNWSNDKLGSLDKLFQRLVMWHNTRAHFMDCLVSQKMGLYQHCYFGANQGDNPFTRSLESVESLVKQSTLPTREFATRSHTTSSTKAGPPSSSSSTPSRPNRTRRLHPALPPFNQTYENVRLKRPLQGSPHKLLTDPVQKHGAQFGEICKNVRKELEVQQELENVYITWENQKKGHRSRNPNSVISEDTLRLLKQRSRVVHYCATPFLFNPNWRQHLTSDPSGAGCEVASLLNPSNEAPWHNELKNRLVPQYKQFLNTLGFTTVETTALSMRPGPKHLRASSEQGFTKRLSLKHPPEVGVEGHLQMTSPGGIILIELSFRHTYFCVKLFAFESSRVPAGKTINKQLATRFSDECDKLKHLIHIHSFSYDFHLRSIQVHLLNPDLGYIKTHYHVSSFLSCFIKHYDNPPPFRQNYIKKDVVRFLSLNTPAPKLYDYLVNHPPQGWRKILMDRSPPSSTNSTPEVGLPSDHTDKDYALCRIHSNLQIQEWHGNRFIDDLDVGVVLAWDEASYRSQTRPNSPAVGAGATATAAAAQSESTAMHHKNMLQLEYYVFVTGRKEKYQLRSVSAKQVPIPVSTLKPTSTNRSTMAESECAAEQGRIVGMLRTAEIHCRRDMLWDRLLMWGAEDMESVAMAASISSKKGKKRDSAEEDDSQSTMSYPEFKVLLGCVHHTPLTSLDPSIQPLLHNPVPWYRELFRSLRAAPYPIITRCINSEDGKIRHLVLLLGDISNQVVLITVDQTTEYVELELLRKELPGASTDGAGSELNTFATQKHIENIINAIGFHLWTTVF